MQIVLEAEVFSSSSSGLLTASSTYQPMQKFGKPAKIEDH